MVSKLIVDGNRAKVYENDNGTYSVYIKRMHNWDGIMDTSWDEEIFEEDGMHSGSGYCAHNHPIKYPNDGKTLRERALEFADSYNKKR